MSSRIIIQIKCYQEYNNISRIYYRIFENDIWNEWMPINKSMGFKNTGTTEERPRLTSSDIGFQYLDTTLLIGPLSR